MVRIVKSYNSAYYIKIQVKEYSIYKNRRYVSIWLKIEK